MSFENVTREQTVTMEVMENKQLVSKPVIVRYKSLTVKQLREQEQMFRDREAAEETVWLSETLAGRVVELVEEDGKVTKVTQNLLDEMALENLKAIDAAIKGDTDPK